MLRLQVLGDKDDSRGSHGPAGDEAAWPGDDSAGRRSLRGGRDRGDEALSGARASEPAVRDLGSGRLAVAAPRGGFALQANRAGLDLTGKPRLFHLQSSKVSE